MLKVHRYEIVSLGENTYLIENDQGDCLVIDPGGDSQKLLAWIESKALKPQAILLTHGHFDHIGALDAVRDYYHIPAYLHQIEASFLQDANLNLSQGLIGIPVLQRPADYLWSEMGPQIVAGFEFEIHHLPGHSPGSVVYIFNEDAFVIGGDTLFYGSIGRTDFPGGSLAHLLEGIKSHLLTLPEDYVVYPGHGPQTSIGRERMNNPFLQSII